MTYRLIKKTADQQLIRFQVANDKDEIVGSVNVPTDEVAALLRCWSGSTADSAPPKGSASAMVAAFLQHRSPFKKAAVLRGCL